MTDYTAMPAGREMDSEVAEKIMGWTVELIVGSRAVGTFEEWRDAQGWRYNLFPYSMDIAAAWLVVEQMTNGDDGWIFKLMTHVQGWRAIFGIAHVAIAESAPLAICRAALIAVSPPR